MRLMNERLLQMGRDPKQVSSLLRMIFRLFEMWNLDARQRTILLGVRSTSTIYRWRKHGTTRLRIETLERMYYLLGIQKRLRLLFYRNPDMGKTWVSTPNKASCFGGNPPIVIMLRGKVSDLALVLDYLEQAA